MALPNEGVRLDPVRHQWQRLTAIRDRPSESLLRVAGDSAIPSCARCNSAGPGNRTGAPVLYASTTSLRIRAVTGRSAVGTRSAGA